MTLSDKLQFVVDHCWLTIGERMFAGNRNDKLKEALIKFDESPV